MKYSEENLIKNGFENVSIYHGIFPDRKLGDLLLWRLDENIELLQFRAEYEEAKKFFSEIIIGGNKIKINRILKKFKLKILKEKEVGNAKAVCFKIR